MSSARYQFFVDLDGDASLSEVELFDECCQRRAFGDFVFVAVEMNLHDLPEINH